MPAARFLWTALMVAAALQGRLRSAPAQAPAPGPEVASVAELQARLRAHLAGPRFDAAEWGVKVIHLETGATVFEHQSAKLLRPASTAKLFTAALALDRLGPDSRIATSLYSAARPGADGVLRGDLLVYGRGDPSFAPRYRTARGADTLDVFVQALTNAGVRRIEGDLVGDDSFFQGPPHGSAWTLDDAQSSFGAEVSALSLDGNVVDLGFTAGPVAGAPAAIRFRPDTDYLTLVNRTRTTGKSGRQTFHLYRPPGGNVVFASGEVPAGVTNGFGTATLHRPAQWFVHRLRAVLQARGIPVTGRARSIGPADPAPEYAKLVEIASVEGRSLAEILKPTLKHSLNLEAQLLLLQVGATHAPAGAVLDPAAPTESAGIAALKEFVTAAGIGAEGVRLDEGSGLSRNSLVTAGALVALLRWMDRHPRAEVFRGALPVAGVDGTLVDRLKGTPAARNARAKTGSLNSVSTLAGYLTTAAGDRLVFAVMLNNTPESAGSARDSVDFIPALLAGVRFSLRQTP